MTSKSKLYDRIEDLETELKLTSSRLSNALKVNEELQAEARSLALAKFREEILTKGKYEIVPVVHSGSLMFEVHERVAKDVKDFGLKRRITCDSREEAERVISEFSKGITYYDASGDEVEPAE